MKKYENIFLKVISYNFLKVKCINSCIQYFKGRVKKNEEKTF